MKEIATILFLIVLCGCTKNQFERRGLVTKNVRQYEKAEFEMEVKGSFENPYDQREIAINMVLKSPSGKSLSLPCFFDQQVDGTTFWRARFTPQESGKYKYHFEYISNGDAVERTSVETFTARPSNEDGFLHVHDLWTLRFDSGKPFRGIGENIGWEPRSFSNPKWTYDYLLPKLSQNGANFFRSWMAPNNFPLEWKTVKNTNLYSDTDQYLNPGGIRRLDEVVNLADSLGMYMMLAFDSHNTLIEGNQWEIHNYNVKNGGPASTPKEFFTLKESRERYKNRLRYIVARWGYSPNIAAWEFFNEIDNAAFSDGDSVIIPLDVITDWHREMAAYLKAIDPYDHIVTTSVSHREIPGLYEIEEMDLNQMHIYKRTRHIPEGTKRFTQRHNKPFAWGEFAFEWDWNKDFEVIGEQMDFDFKRGLWYGLFSPTPILPMSWWWEYFDRREMTPYFRSVREINDLMLEAGKGSFESINVESTVESYGVKCGDTYFAYLLNNSSDTHITSLRIESMTAMSVQFFDPSKNQYSNPENIRPEGDKIKIERITLAPGTEAIVILRPIRNY